MITGKEVICMWPFKKKSNNVMSEEQTKCDGCGKMKNSSECTKTADGKCLCKDCNQEAQK